MEKPSEKTVQIPIEVFTGYIGPTGPAPPKKNNTYENCYVIN